MLSIRIITFFNFNCGTEDYTKSMWNTRPTQTSISSPTILQPTNMMPLPKKGIMAGAPQKLPRSLVVGSQGMSWGDKECYEVTD